MLAVSEHAHSCARTFSGFLTRPAHLGGIYTRVHCRCQLGPMYSCVRAHAPNFNPTSHPEDTRTNCCHELGLLHAACVHAPTFDVEPPEGHLHMRKLLLSAWMALCLASASGRHRHQGLWAASTAESMRRAPERPPAPNKRGTACLLNSACHYAQSVACPWG